MEDWEVREDRFQLETRRKISEMKLGCWYCIHFGRGQYPGCHTAAHRNGNTCDLFNRDDSKR